MAVEMKKYTDARISKLSNRIADLEGVVDRKARKLTMAHNQWDKARRQLQRAHVALGKVIASVE